MTKLVVNRLLFAFVLMASYANAESPHQHRDHHGDHHESRQEAHLHGYAELTLAIESGVVEIIFESPAANIVGFEHQAASPEQIKALRDAKNLLESPSKLFKFTGTDCAPDMAQVDISGLLNESPDEHKHGDSKHSEAHSEITAEYKYRCKKGEQVSSFDVSIARQFPGVEKLRVSWITDLKQGAALVTADASRVDIEAP